MVSARVLGLRDVGEELARVADVGCGLVANLEGDPLSPFEHDVRMGERRVGDATHDPLAGQFFEWGTDAGHAGADGFPRLRPRGV